MTAFFVASVAVKNPDKFQDYSQKAAATISAHGGEVILRGKAESALAGVLAHQAVGIVGFPSMAALTAWFNSPEYQAIVPLRDEAADMSIITYAGG